MQFELKLADTGHSETLTLDKNARGQALFQLIAQEYKINYDEQFLLTRSGGRISPEVSLQKTLIEPVGNATITGKYNSKYSSQTKACLYLFNVKEMSKIVEPLEQNFRNKRKAQLNQQLELYNNLRPQVSSFESLQNLYPKEVLENYAKAYDQINDLKKYYQRLTNQYLVLKEIYRKIEILADQCENQRKSIRPLGAYVGNLAESLKVNAEHLANLKVNLKEKFSSEENNLNKNSKFFEINKQQDQIMRYHEGKINDLRGRMKSTLNELKNMVKYRQEAFKDCQNTILTFENKNYGKKLDQEIANGVKQYNKILSDFKNLVESQDYKYMNMIESAAQSQTKYAGEQIQHKYSELYGILVDYYVQVSRYNYNNIELVRSRFKEASRLKIAIDEFQKEVQEQKKLLNNQFIRMDSKVMKEQFYTDKNSIEDRSEVSVESEKNLQAFKASIKTEAEVKRRVKFYKKLTYIQSLAFKLCSQEEQLRKRYVNESKKGKQNSKQLLRNIKVPNLDIDTDGTTDLELNKMNRDMTLSEEDMGCEDFMLIQYNQMMEHINNLVGKDKNTKIQNLQQLLTIATSVFKKIYEKNSQKIDLKSSKLIQQRQEQTMRIKELQQRCIRYQTQIDQYQKSVEMLHATIAEKEQYALNIDQVKNEQIAKQKSLYQKVLADRKKVEAELKSQVKLNEELFNQFSMLDEDFEKQKLQNSQLKEMLAQKEVQLINMQKQLSDKTSKIGVQSIIYDPNEQAENELKQVVVQNLNQKIQQNSDQIIKKLQNQNQLLKSDNESYEAEIESLQQQIQQITEQLNKLILKKTEDIHVQVDSHQDTMGFKNDSISIGDDISIGQNAIFMPYNNNLYIGVSSKDEDRTLCNVNGLHQPNYILNLDCFPSKTRELLSECSLLLVLKVEHLSKTGINYSVEGKIQYLLGFEEDNLAVKNYVPYLG